MKKHASEFLFWRFGVCAVILGFFIFISARDTLADLAWQKFGRPDLALILVRKNADLAMLLGNYYFGETLGKSEYDLEKAKRAFVKAVAASPGILWGHYQIARIHFVRREFMEALREINEELKANPENLRSLYVRGLIYGYRKYSGDLLRAEDDFRRFTEWAPTEWAGHNDLIWVLLKQQKYQEALEASRIAFIRARGAETNPWLWSGKGLALLNLEMKKESVRSFEKALETSETLSESDWVKAYPGNNPASAPEGLGSFKKALRDNLASAENIK